MYSSAMPARANRLGSMYARAAGPVS